jgi:putative heme-binding domain-containing protein
MRALATALFSILLAASTRGASPQSPPANAVPLQQPDIASGKRIFESHCALCHGLDGGGGRGPSLRRPKLNHAADDEALKSLIENGIPPEMPEAWFLSNEEIVSLAAFVRSLGNVPPEILSGDPARGKTIYARSGCSACHILNGDGSGFGPDLTDIGARRGSLHLRETLQNPAKTLPEDFLLVEVTTILGQINSGLTVRGIRLNEDTFSIQLKDQQGILYSFRKSELRGLKKLRGETPMPSFGAALSPAELDDLVHFLATQRGKP